MSQQLDVKKVAAAFAERLATQKLSDKAVAALAERVVEAKAKPIGIDISQFGIVIDYRTPRNGLAELIQRLEQDRILAGIKIFPEGIIDPDAFRISVEYEVQR
jgi:hypothetical protein